MIFRSRCCQERREEKNRIGKRRRGRGGERRREGEGGGEGRGGGGEGEEERERRREGEEDRGGERGCERGRSEESNFNHHKLALNSNCEGYTHKPQSVWFRPGG